MPVPSLSAGKSTSRAVGPGNRGRLSPRGARELSAWRRRRGAARRRRAGARWGGGEAAAILSPTRPGGGTERLASRARHRPARGGWRRSSATLTGPPELRHGAVARRLRARRHSIPLPGRVPDRFCDTGWPGPGGPGPGGPGNRGRAAVGIAGAPYGGRNRRSPIRRSESRAPQTAIALAPDGDRAGPRQPARAARGWSCRPRLRLNRQRGSDWRLHMGVRCWWSVGAPRGRIGLPRLCRLPPRFPPRSAAKIARSRPSAAIGEVAYRAAGESEAAADTRRSSVRTRKRPMWRGSSMRTTPERARR